MIISLYGLRTDQRVYRCALINFGKLPTWERVERGDVVGDMAKKQVGSTTIVNFLRYHIRNNAMFAVSRLQAEVLKQRLLILPMRIPIKLYWLLEAHFTIADQPVCTLTDSPEIYQ